MRSRNRRWLNWVLGAATVAALAFGLVQYRDARDARLRIQASHQRALYNLVSHIENIESNLAKARAASSMGQQVNFLTASYLNAQAARSDLSLAGVDGVDLTKPRRFIATVGDYAAVLSQKLARGEPVTPNEWAELQRLEEGVKDLAGVLASTARESSRAGVRPGTRAALLELAGTFLGASAPSDSLNHGFSEIDTLTQSIPAPVYDGPFSEKNLAQQALANPGPMIDEEQARSIALSFLTPGEAFQSVSVGNIDGVIPSYLVTAARADGSQVATTVAKQGGAVVLSTDSALSGGPGAIDMDAARAKALEFLKSRGFTTLEETGWRKPGPDGQRVVFAYVPHASLRTENGELKVRLYPDTVKVEVNLATGAIVSFDQLNYLVTHDHPGRVLKAPLVSAAEARAVLKSDLSPVDPGPRLCVIPILPTTEALAWEFKVRQGADTYLVYVNAMTGKEQVVLQLIEDESGAMAV
jgi:germination protein YpeB